MAVLLDGEGTGPPVLHRVTEAVQRTHARVPAPGEHEAVGAAGADELVVDHVGRHPHEAQVSAPLADQLVPGGVRDEVREPLHGHRVAVVDERGHGVAQRRDLGRHRFG
jgi:hypothetical protein